MQIRVDDHMPFLVRRTFGRDTVRNAGIIECNIDLSIPLLHIRRNLSNELRIRYITMNKLEVAWPFSTSMSTITTFAPFSTALKKETILVVFLP
jgi:hypothetical protein